jgi:hypothetical protein
VTFAVAKVIDNRAAVKFEFLEIRPHKLGQTLEHRVHTFFGGGKREQSRSRVIFLPRWGKMTMMNKAFASLVSYYELNNN